MKKTDSVKYFFSKSPLLRAFIFVSIIALILGGVYIFKNQTKPVPHIDAITPPVGSPGEVVVISGRNFGKERDMNYVEFSGSKLTASSYLMWTDNTIKLVIPSNIQNGLVVVGNGKLRSKPAFFANITDIPVEVQEVRQTSTPVISEITYKGNDLHSSKAWIGDVLTISGSNFGNSRGTSKVYFSSNFEGAGERTMANMVPALEDDLCYEYWSDNEIRVRIPDGAVSGYALVETPSGKSEMVETVFTDQAGQKSFVDKKIYLIQYSVDLADITVSESSTITLRCPIPVVSSNQLETEMTEVSPSPVLENYQKTMIHQLAVDKSVQNKTFFTQSYVMPVYGIKTKIDEIKAPVKNQEISDVLFSMATRSDELIPSDNEKIIELASSIVKAEKKPHIKARLIYKYMIENFKIDEKFRKNEADPLDLLRKKRGDAYDFAIIYTALLRAVDVPAFADCGVLVSPDLSTRNHMWAEFYLSGVGWIPVDPALGAGMNYGKWDENLDSADFYFGNLDSHHIKFSRGINSLRPFSKNNKIVQRPRSFAFQSFWEEASSGTVKYSSYWSDPVVKGIY